MSIFLAEEKKKREGKRGKYVLWEIIQIISNNLEPRPGSHQNFWDLQNLFHSAMPTRKQGFSDSLAGIIIRRRSCGEIRCLPWVIYHTQPLLDMSVSWPSALEMERNGLGIFFHTLTSRICHLQLGTPFHNRPTVSELESLAASLLLTWKEPLYVRLSRQEILREHNIFLYCQIWQNFRPSGILHLEYLLLLHVSSTSPWALTNLRSCSSLLASVRDQPPEIKIETLRERTNYIL